MARRYLVTGGAGFLGSHLCARLLRDGHTVLCLDNFFTGQRRHVARLQTDPHFSLLERDVREPLDIAVDGIFHLACPASPPHYQRDPIFTTTTSVIGTLRMLELAKLRRIPLLFTSTSEVYGDPEEHPQRESYRGAVNPLGPRACYDEGKRCAESLCAVFARANTAVKVVRIFNTYGPQMAPDDGRVVSQFILQALRGEPLTVFGDGTQTRSLCYVDDLIDGLMRMMASPYTLLDGPVNLGNPEEYSILDISRQVATLCDVPHALVHHTLPADDPTRRRPDIARAQQWLQWTPQIPLAEGLRRTVDYFRPLR